MIFFASAEASLLISCSCREHHFQTEGRFNNIPATDTSANPRRAPFENKVLVVCEMSSYIVF